MIKELVSYVVKQLVNYPDDVHVSVDTSGERDVVEITVNEQDRGKVIGREGQIIKSIRMLVAAASSETKRIVVDVAR